MSQRSVFNNPFAHNASFTPPINQPTEQQAVNSPPSNPTSRYGAPPPAGASPSPAVNSPISSSPVSSPVGSFSPINNQPGVFNPMMSSVPSSTGSPVTPVSKYGAPPPVGQSNESSSSFSGVSRPPTTFYSNEPSYNPPSQSPNSFQNQPSGPKYAPPPQVGEPIPIDSPTITSSQGQPLTAEEKVLRFPSPVELIATQTEEATKFNTSVHPNPPPAASRYITVDQGNCGPRYIRSSTYCFPSTPDIAKKTALPLGFVLQPLADPGIGENGVPIVDSGREGPIRCARCRAYMCALNQFINGGRNFKCFLCSHINEVPDEYFSPLAPNGYRMDYLQRPELSRGSIEYVASSEYITQSPRPISYLFVVDVSASSIQQGVLRSFATSAKAIIDSLPDNNASRFGLITFDSSIQFYNLNPSYSKPQIMVTPDIQDIFLPVAADGNLLVNPVENKELFTSLLDNLPNYYSQNHSTGCAFGSAIKAASLILEEHGGKMITFLASFPNINPGKLEQRFKPEFTGTAKEMEYFKPQTTFYQLEAEKCVKQHIGIDLFVFATTYMDIATLACLSKTTGGQLFFYPRYSMERDMIKLHNEFYRVLTRTTGYNGVMRLRASAGIEIVNYYGNHMLTYGTDMEVANIDCDKVFSVSVRNEGAIQDNTNVGVQCAMLYTTSLGERRIRVHSLQIPVSKDYGNIFGGADLETITYLLTTKSIKRALTTVLADVRKQVITDVIQIVYGFRKYASKKSFEHRILVIPEGLKLLPLYIICLHKNILLKGGRVSVDFRVYSRMHLSSMSVGELTIALYPRMFALHSMPENAGTQGDDGYIILPPWERLLNQSLQSNGCYLLDNGRRMFLWIGRDVDPQFSSRVFNQTESGGFAFASNDDPLASRVKAIISAVQLEHPSYKLLVIAKQGGDNELAFSQMMFEERVEDSMSHSDVLSLVHREVCKKLGKPV